MDYCCYILYSETLQKFYIGETKNLEERLDFHKKALPHKFTAKAKDWEIYLVLLADNKEHAVNMERHIKKMKSSIYIRNLKSYPEMQSRLIEKTRV
jgi:putative endonuclease